MREVAKWIRGMPVNGRAANHRLPGDAVLGTGLADVITERANHGLLVVTHGAERLNDEAGAPIHDLEDEPAAAILFVGSTTEPSPGQKGRPRINGDALHNPYPPGAPEFIDSAVRDITPYTRRLRQARLRARELVRANRRKDEFLAMLSHELRSPLAAIQNAVRLLSSQTGETPARESTQALIGRQVRRMTQLVDDLLDVSRISHGRLCLQRERIDLRVVVSNAIETLESDINERHHRLSTALPDAPVWLEADPGRLEQVFVNLLANASRYTEAGGELAVWVHTRDGQAVVGIRDSGIGIASDAFPHIFDLFKQADEATPRSKSGLGIGLALVRKLVELHAGSVTAASEGIGQGSEFTVRLPRKALKGASRSAVR
jgi:signal transduction histidine kinase